MIRGVVFDVGETLVDERGLWSQWADWLGVERDRFLTALCDVIERGEHHRRVFELFRPGIDLATVQARRRAASDDPGFRLEDFFPDALPCLRELKRMGLRLGVAGNTSAETERLIECAGLPADFIASSATWGVEKPSPAFFSCVVEAAGYPARELAYVGDRLDNDVLPAMRAGLTGIFVRRGLWAGVQRHWPQAASVDIAVNSLAELPEALAAHQLARSRDRA